MNTFFFGYLSLKWKRLVRVLCIVFSLIFIYVNHFDNLISGATVENNIIGIILIITSITLLSYVIKPFVVK